jgi:FkbM family methyltransferase
VNRIRNLLLTSAWGRALKVPVQRTLGRLGYSLVPTPVAYADFVKGLLARQAIELLLDVGANQGQYAVAFRDRGFTGRIISFEPMQEAYERLARAARDDPRWTTRNVALGDTAGVCPLHVAANSVSSSLLPMADLHLQAEPASREVRVERVSVATLDDALSDEPASTRLWLKLDVQGYEERVLGGASRVVTQAQVVQCELSTRQLYEGQSHWVSVLTRLDAEGFSPVYILPGFSSATTGELLQFDLVMARHWEP